MVRMYTRSSLCRVSCRSIHIPGSSASPRLNFLSFDLVIFSITWDSDRGLLPRCSTETRLERVQENGLRAMLHSTTDHSTDGWTYLAGRSTKIHLRLCHPIAVPGNRAEGDPKDVRFLGSS